MIELNREPEKPVQLAGKAMIWQATRMGVVKVIFLVRIALLAHLLLPADFGLLAIATTTMGFLSNVTDFGMIPALIQGKETTNAQYNSAWTVGLLRAAFISALMFVTAPWIAALFSEPASVGIIRILAFFPLLGSMSSIKVAAFNRNIHFRPQALLEIVSAVVNTTVSVILAYRIGVWGLAAGMLAGAASAFVFSYILAPHRPRLSFKWNDIRPLIAFGRWIFISSLITLAGSYVLRIVISRQLGVTGLGLYYLATQFAFLPASIASEVVGKVAFPLFSRLQHNINQATQVFQGMLTSLAVLLFPASALIIVLAPGISRDILGANWAGSEPVIQVLAIVSMIGIFGEAVVPVLKGFGHPNRVTFLELTQSISIICLIWVLTSWLGLVGAALAWLPAIALSQLISAHFVHKVLNKPFAGLFKPFAVIVIITALSAALAALLHTLIPGLFGVILAGIFAAALVIILLLIFDIRFALGFQRNLTLVFPTLARFIRVQTTEQKNVRQTTL